MSARIADVLSPREREAINAFVERIRKQYPDRVSRIILFGSKARGDSRPESDIDILLVADTDHWRFRHAISDIASDVSLTHSVLIAPRVIAQARWERMRSAGYGLYQNVMRDGVSLG
jgi:predicted nucleotidyltransferase